MPRPHLSRPTATLMLLLSACVAPQAVQPPPVPVPMPAVAPHAPATTDWRDIPLTPGDWHYTAVPGGSMASFGRSGASPAFVIRCDAAARTISLMRVVAAPDTPAGPGRMAITTSAGDRVLATSAGSVPLPSLVATLPAGDGFLDRMAFSRGRFVIAVGETPRLVIPAWPEFARVIEDCRA